MDIDRVKEEAWLRWALLERNPKMPKKGSAPAKTPGEAFRAGYDAGWEAAQKQVGEKEYLVLCQECGGVTRTVVKQAAAPSCRLCYIAGKNDEHAPCDLTLVYVEAQRTRVVCCATGDCEKCQ